MALVWSVPIYTVYKRVFALRWTRGLELEPQTTLHHPTTQRVNKGSRVGNTSPHAPSHYPEGIVRLCTGLWCDWGVGYIPPVKLVKMVKMVWLVAGMWGGYPQ